MERAQTEAQSTVPPSNPMMDYLFSFMFFLQVRTQQFQIKNNPKSDYAKACKTYDDDDEFGKHGIEFRIYATRIDFKRLEEEYWVEFGVNVEIGFSFSTKM